MLFKIQIIFYLNIYNYKYLNNFYQILHHFVFFLKLALIHYQK